MELSNEAKKKIQRLAKTYTTLVRNQAPSSKIASGTTIVPVYGDKTIGFEPVLAKDVFYGQFLDEGTGPYYSRNTIRGKWNPDPGKGTGGIIPRFWLTLEEAMEERINMMLDDILAEEAGKEAEDKLPEEEIDITLEI